MDLIYTNPDRVDIGVLHEYELDLAFGADENNFECTINAAAHCCEAGSYLYFDGTEYGGIIDGIQSNGNDKEVIYSGRTWHGILNSKVIEPDSGEAYLTVSGEANAVLGTLIDRMGLADLYEASSDNSGLTISNYKMHRYISGYDGITKMLDSVGARIRVVFTGGKVILSAVKKYDYSKDEEFDSDQVGFTIKKNYKAVNHLICLGSGELEKRLVVHLYVDKDGNISQTQTQFGLDEVSSIYEYSSISTEEELIAAGTEQLAGLNESEEVSIDFDAESDVYDVGDVVGAYDNITGLYISTRIAKKIVTIKNGKITVSLTPDTAKTGSTMESSASASAGGNVEPCIHTNPNLLDNWYFGNPVNQRGQTEYSGARQYCVDRWTLVAALSAKIENGSIEFTNTGTSNNGTSQHLNAHLTQGTVITMSCLMADGGLYYGTTTVPDTDKYNRAFTTAAGNTGRIYAATSDGVVPRFIFMMTGGATEQIVAFKLEFGTQQTLAHQDENGNWVLNEIPNFSEQMLRCIQSTADPSDTYANKVVATTSQLCNPNLLDNWYFLNPVNQRGKAEYTSDTYSIDRWKNNYTNNIVKLEADGVRWSNGRPSGSTWFHQGLDFTLPAGVYTLSALVTDVTGTVYFYLGHDGTAFAGTTNGATVGVVQKTYTITEEDGANRVQITIGQGASVKIAAIKLEVGSVQTLAHKDASGNWVLNEIPNAQMELLKCSVSTADSSDTYANKMVQFS